MNNLSLDKIKEMTYNCGLLIKCLLFPMITMFVTLITSNKLVSLEIAKQLNITFMNTLVISYTNYVIPATALIVTFRDIKRYNGIVLDEVIRITVMSIVEFVAVALIFFNFQLSLGIDVIDFNTGIYYTATSMVEFMSLSFFIFGFYLIYSEIKNHSKKQ